MRRITVVIDGPGGKKKQRAIGADDGIDPETDSKTEREVEREEENREFTSVIVKRTDEALRHPDDILENAIVEGLEQLERSTLSLFLSAMAAGLILGFTAMSVAVVTDQTLSLDLTFVSRLSAALVYPLGFVLCIMSGTQLFTEHTATAVYPILDRRGKIKSLLWLWMVVILGNLTGALCSAGFLVAADEVIQAEQGYIAIGHHLVSFGGGPLFISAVLAGWLMALGAWLIMATQPTLSQMLSIYIVTFVIGLGGLHHSIAGSVEIFTAYLISNHFSLTQVIDFISLTIFGNLVGGSIFVALLNYAHIRGTQKNQQD
jgi:formate/nitrite transporter FocA (FNT family)